LTAIKFLVPTKVKCPDTECGCEWTYNPTKRTKSYYIQCPQCRIYHKASEVIIQ
jgi:hypothetical protein